MRRHHKEWFRQAEGLVTNCHLTLLHRLKKGRLNFCRGTVNLVGEYEIGENRSATNLELLGFLGINHCSDDIRRKKVRSELYSAEFGIHRRRQSVDCQGFCQSRHTFEKYVSVREKPYEKVLNELFLAHYDLVHFH